MTTTAPRTPRTTAGEPVPQPQGPPDSLRLRVRSTLDRHAFVARAGQDGDEHHADEVLGAHREPVDAA